MMRCVLTALVAALSFAAVPGAYGAGHVVNVAVVRDGSTGRDFLTTDRIRAAVADTVTADIEVRFPEDRLYVADWTIQGVDTAIDRALTAPDVDVVLLLGVLASHQGAQRRTLPLPVIAPFVSIRCCRDFRWRTAAAGARISLTQPIFTA